MTEEEIKNHFDLNNDGEVTEEEIQKVHKMDTFLNDDQKSDTQRKMAWFALIGMLLYPFGVVLCIGIGWVEAAELLRDMASIYFGSVSIIVAAFFGAEAYSKIKKRI